MEYQGDLGSASGRIELDLSQLEEAAKRVQQLAKTMDKALSSIGGRGGRNESFKELLTQLNVKLDTMKRRYESLEKAAARFSESGAQEVRVLDSMIDRLTVANEIGKSLAATNREIAKSTEVVAKAQEQAAKSFENVRTQVELFTNVRVRQESKSRRKKSDQPSAIEKPVVVEAALMSVLQQEVSALQRSLDIAEANTKGKEALKKANQAVAQSAQSMARAEEQSGGRIIAENKLILKIKEKIAAQNQQIEASALSAFEAELRLATQIAAEAQKAAEAKLKLAEAARQSAQAVAQETQALRSASAGRRQGARPEIASATAPTVAPTSPQTEPEVTTPAATQAAVGQAAALSAAASSAQSVAQNASAAAQAAEAHLVAATQVAQQQSEAAEVVQSAAQVEQQIADVVEQTVRVEAERLAQARAIEQIKQAEIRNAAALQQKGAELSAQEQRSYEVLLAGLRKLNQEREKLFVQRARGAGGYNPILGQAELDAFNKRLRQTAAEMAKLLAQPLEKEQELARQMLSVERAYQRQLETIREAQNRIVKMRSSLTKDGEEEKGIRAQIQVERDRIEAGKQMLAIQEEELRNLRERVGMLQMARAIERGRLGEAAALEVRSRWTHDYDLAGERPTVGSFIQFSTMPASMALSELGAQGVANFVNMAGAFAGVADTIGPLVGQVDKLSRVLLTQNGIFGALARSGFSLLIPLGGIAAKIGAILGVIAPFAVALAGIAVLLEQLRVAEEARARAIERGANALRSAAESAATGTSVEIRRQIQEQQRLLQAQRTIFAQTLAIGEEFNRLIQERTEAILVGGLSAGVGPGLMTNFAARVVEINERIAELDRQAAALGFENADQASGALQQLRDQIAETERSIDAYNLALESQIVVINDTIEAIRREDEARVARVELTRQLRQATQSQLQEELRNRLSEIADLRTLIANSADPEVIQRLEERIATLRNEERALVELIASGSGLRNTLQGISETIRTSINLYEEFRRQERQLLEQRKLAAQRDFEDFVLARRRRFEDQRIQDAREREDRERDIAKRIADLEKQDAADLLKFEKEKKKLQDDYRAAELKAARDLQQALEKIYREGRLAILEAAARLDARAVLEAQRRTAERVRDEMMKARDEAQQRQKQMGDRLAEMQREREQERLERKARFNEQLRDEAEAEAIRRRRRMEDLALQLQRENEDRALRLRRMQEDYAIEDRLRQMEFQRRVMQTIQQNETLNSITRAGFNLIQSAFVNFFNSTASSLSKVGALSGYTMSSAPLLPMPQPVTQGNVTVSVGDIVFSGGTNATPGQIRDAVKAAVLYGGVGDELLRRFYGRVVTR